MATAPPKPHPMGPDSLIIIKVSIDNINRRFKLALRDLGAHVLPQKVSCPYYQGSLGFSGLLVFT